MIDAWTRAKVFDCPLEFEDEDEYEAFEDLPPSCFSEFRRAAADLGLPVEVLCLVVVKDYVRRRRQQQQGFLVDSELRQN